MVTTRSNNNGDMDPERVRERLAELLLDYLREKVQGVLMGRGLGDSREEGYGICLGVGNVEG